MGLPFHPFYLIILLGFGFPAALVGLLVWAIRRSQRPPAYGLRHQTGSGGGTVSSGSR